MPVYGYRINLKYCTVKRWIEALSSVLVVSSPRKKIIVHRLCTDCPVRQRKKS